MLRENYKKDHGQKSEPNFQNVTAAIHAEAREYSKWVGGGGGQFDINAMLDNPHDEFRLTPDSDREKALKAKWPLFHNYIYHSVFSRKLQRRLNSAEKKLRYWQNPKLMARHKNREKSLVFVVSTYSTKEGKQRHTISNDIPALEAWIKQKREDIARKVMITADLTVHLNQDGQITPEGVMRRALMSRLCHTSREGIALLSAERLIKSLPVIDRMIKKLVETYKSTIWQFLADLFETAGSGFLIVDNYVRMRWITMKKINQAFTQQHATETVIAHPLDPCVLSTAPDRKPPNAPYTAESGERVDKIIEEVMTLVRTCEARTSEVIEAWGHWTAEMVPRDAHAGDASLLQFHHGPSIFACSASHWDFIETTIKELYHTHLGSLMRAGKELGLLVDPEPANLMEVATRRNYELVKNIILIFCHFHWKQKGLVSFFCHSNDLSQIWAPYLMRMGFRSDNFSKFVSPGLKEAPPPTEPTEPATADDATAATVAATATAAVARGDDDEANDDMPLRTDRRAALESMGLGGTSSDEDEAGSGSDKEGDSAPEGRNDADRTSEGMNGELDEGLWGMSDDEDEGGGEEVEIEFDTRGKPVSFADLGLTDSSGDEGGSEKDDDGDDSEDDDGGNDGNSDDSDDSDEGADDQERANKAGDVDDRGGEGGDGGDGNGADNARGGEGIGEGDGAEEAGVADAPISGGTSTKDRKNIKIGYDKLLYFAQLRRACYVGRKGNEGEGVRALIIADLRKMYPAAETDAAAVDLAWREHPDFKYLWEFHNTDLFIWVDVFEEAETGNILPLLKFLPLVTVHIAFYGQYKIVRTLLPYLARLEYWREHRPDIIRTLALNSKVLNDIFVERANSRIRRAMQTTAYDRDDIRAASCLVGVRSRFLRAAKRAMGIGGKGHAPEMRRNRERIYHSTYDHTRAELTQTMLDEFRVSLRGLNRYTYIDKAANGAKLLPYMQGLFLKYLDKIEKEPLQKPGAPKVRKERKAKESRGGTSGAPRSCGYCKGEYCPGPQSRVRGPKGNEEKVWLCPKKKADLQAAGRPLVERYVPKPQKKK